MKRDRFAGFSLFKKAFEATKHEIAISLQVLALVTIAFAIVMGIVFVVAIPRQFFNPQYWKIRRVNKKKNEVVSQ